MDEGETPTQAVDPRAERIANEDEEAENQTPSKLWFTLLGVCIYIGGYLGKVIADALSPLLFR